MRALYLLRHGVTEANERRLYCGSTDLTLSAQGEAMARECAIVRPLPECELYVSSGMKRANETLAILTGHVADRILPELCEMDFGRFEMLDYNTLCDDADYLKWIGADGESFLCPGGESTLIFRRRVLSGGHTLLVWPWDSAVVVCHGGVIVQLMQAWFPSENRHYYQWQPTACHGWLVTFDNQTPVCYKAV